MKQYWLDEVYGFLAAGILCLDPADRIGYLNPFALSELGLVPEKIIGEKFTDLFVEEKSSMPGRRTWRFSADQRLRDFSCPEAYADQKLPVASILSSGEYKDWRIMRFAAPENGAQELPKAFSELGLILLHDKNVRIISGSRTLEELLGYEEPKENSGKSTRQRVIPADCPVAQTLSDGQIHRKEFLLDGREYLVASYPIITEEKNADVLVTYLDMTDINETQRKLFQAMHEAEAANKAKSFFLANMSHELRTPLNAVIGYCELLQEGGLMQKEIDDYLGSINLSGNALLRLINNILDLSKIEAEQMALVLKPSDMTTLFMELKTLFRQSCRKNNIEQLMDIEPNLPLLLIDELRLRQIMLNLIGNACKFTTNGSINIRIRHIPNGAPDSGTLRIAVEDTGIGIAEDKLESIFKPFSQQDAKKNPQVYKGTGLGLAISNAMVQRMGGRIELQSELGKGSTFTVVLENVTAVRRDIALNQAVPQELPDAFLAGLDVMLVDDLLINVKMLSAMCNTFKVKNRTACSAMQALELMRAAPPNLVLSDMWMPEMSGLDLLAAIRKDDQFKAIPVVIVTADVEAKEKGDLEKFDAIILKPVSKDKLRQLFIQLSGQKKPDQI